MVTDIMRSCAIIRINELGQELPKMGVIEYFYSERN